MKKLLSLLIAMTLVFSLVACGNSNATSQAPAETAAEAEAPTDAPAPSDATFKIGGIGPITGGAAVYGQAVKNAIEIAVDEINAAGGFNGYQVEFRYEDDEHDAEKSVNAYNSLKDWGCKCL